MGLKAQTAAAVAQASTELSERISSLEQEVNRHREDAGKAQAEVDRLLEILREMENEKNDKDRKISELERLVLRIPKTHHSRELDWKTAEDSGFTFTFDSESQHELEFCGISAVLTALGNNVRFSSAGTPFTLRAHAVRVRGTDRSFPDLPSTCSFPQPQTYSVHTTRRIHASSSACVRNSICASVRV
ncbi:ELKS/Rab6-interacting/CAST family member 1 isoform X3 [Tachysurus ichikawai]